MNFSEIELKSMRMFYKYLLDTFDTVDTVTKLVAYIQILSEYLTVLFPVEKEDKYETGKVNVFNQSKSDLLYYICALRNALVHFRGFNMQLEMFIDKVSIGHKDYTVADIDNYINKLYYDKHLFEQLKDILKSCTVTKYSSSSNNTLTPILSNMLKGV